MVMHIPSNGLAAEKARSRRSLRRINMEKVCREGHVAVMCKAASSPETVQQDPHYIELMQRIQEITVLINNSAIPEADKTPLRASLGELEEDLGRFINSRVRAPAAAAAPGAAAAAPGPGAAGAAGGGRRRRSTRRRRITRRRRANK